MNPKKTTPNSIKTKPEKGTTANADSHIAFGGELHQCSAGEHPALTTNQGVPVSDNQNSLKASPRGPELLEDFLLREKMGSTNTMLNIQFLPPNMRTAAGGGQSLWLERSSNAPHDVESKQIIPHFAHEPDVRPGTYAGESVTA